MELKNLYPLKINHISSAGRACFNFDHSRNQTWFMQVLKFSILHSFYLTDLFCVDHGRSRLEINWVLTSYDYESYTRLNQLLPVGFDSSSVSWLWGSATWLEREVWEMFGIRFISHPDLRRLLTDYGFRGRPMVKNFPVVGYNQLSYSERQKRIIPVRTSLAQEFREFDFKSPWLS